MRLTNFASASQQIPFTGEAKCGDLSTAAQPYLNITWRDDQIYRGKSDTMRLALRNKVG